MSVYDGHIRNVFNAVFVLPIRIDHRKCDQMGICISECPTASLNFDGRIVSAKDISEEILRDRVFFDITGGGITLSGGEPLIQPEFSREVLDICRRAGVPTAVETTLAVTWQIVELMTTVTDRFIVDLKVADEQLHREWLGVELDIIQSNLKRLAAQNIDILIRIPLIPGYTATEENLRELGRFISRLKQLPPVELINFNPLAEGKYRLLGRTWPIPHKSRMFNAEEIADFATILRDSGVERILT